MSKLENFSQGLRQLFFPSTLIDTHPISRPTIETNKGLLITSYLRSIVIAGADIAYMFIYTLNQSKHDHTSLPEYIFWISLPLIAVALSGIENISADRKITQARKYVDNLYHASDLVNGTKQE